MEWMEWVRDINLLSTARYYLRKVERNKKKYLRKVERNKKKRGKKKDQTGQRVETFTHVFVHFWW